MKLIKILLKNSFQCVILITSYILSIIGIILPWKMRLLYLYLLEFGARIILSLKYVMNIVKDKAFSKEYEKKMF